MRRVVGYDRYSSCAALAVLQRLYRALCLQHNFFRPVRKLLSRERRGSRVIKRYDLPRTPAQRVLVAEVLPPVARQRLLTQAQTLDPIALAREIEQAVHVLWKLADRPRAVLQEAAGG